MTLWCNQKIVEKSLIAPKQIKLKKIAKGGSLVFFRGSGRRFCFGRGSDISSMFRISIVQVQQMEQSLPYAFKKKQTTL